MASVSIYPCLHCSEHVRNHHQALECEGCKGWQHRGCGDTGVSKYMYAKMRRGEANIEFLCAQCKHEQQATILRIPSVNTSVEAELSSENMPSRMEVDEPSTDHEDNTAASLTSSLTSDMEESLHLPPVPLPEVLDESSIMETTEVHELSQEIPEFQKIEKGTSRGKDLLVESVGYSYTLKKETGTSRLWRCGIRGKKLRCPATVTQRGYEFRRGLHGHTHPADPGLLFKRQITAEVKKAAAGNIFKSAMELTEDQVKKLPNAPNLPNLDDVARKANRHRQKLRPEDPRGMDFQLAEDLIPTGFLRADLTVDGARHLIFATQQQLDILQRAKTWYVDATFKVLRSKDTFEQLFGIHAFLKKDGDTKQVPLVFVCMSRRRKKDYKKVLKEVKKLFDTPPAVKAFVLDFEAAVWRAIKKVFPDVQVTGCAYHWTQAVWKKAQACGLAARYTGDRGTHKLVRRVLSLPLLPAEHIRAAFEEQRQKIGDCEQLRELFAYVHDTWIDGTVWNPEDWSVYGRPVRTNNDTEGWHRRLNTRATTAPPFYVLIDLLHQEAVFVCTQAKLVSEKKLRKTQKKNTKEMSGKVMEVWEKYSEGEWSAQKLLRELACVYHK